MLDEGRLLYKSVFVISKTTCTIDLRGIKSLTSKKIFSFDSSLYLSKVSTVISYEKIMHYLMLLFIMFFNGVSSLTKNRASQTKYTYIANSWTYLKETYFNTLQAYFTTAPVNGITVNAFRYQHLYTYEDINRHHHTLCKSPMFCAIILNTWEVDKKYFYSLF